MIEPHDPIPFKTPSRHERVMRDSSGWKPTAYRSHTIGDVTSGGAGMLGEEVTISGYAETVRGRGACLLYTSPSPRDRSLSRMPSSA